MSTTGHEQPTPTSPQPTPPTPDRRSTIIRAVAGLVLVVLVAAAAVAFQQSRSSSTADAAAAAPVVEAVSPTAVTYEVETSDRAGGMVDITYTTASGIEQQEGVDVPLIRTDGTRGIEVSMTPGSFVSISAQLSTGNGDNGPADVTCRITVGGQVIAENTSTGQFAIATCDGRA